MILTGIIISTVHIREFVKDENISVLLLLLCFLGVFVWCVLVCIGVVVFVACMRPTHYFTLQM